MTRALTILLAVAALTIGGCQTTARIDASGDVHAFLVAVRDGDRAAFEAHVDRPALKAQLKARLLAETANAYGVESREAAAAALAQPLVGLATDVLVQPQVFRAAAQMAGYDPQTAVPNRAVIARALRPLSADRVCVEIDRRCSFVFKNQDGVWRLIAFEGDLTALRAKARR